MSNFEVGYCSVEEYRAHEEKRVMEHELAIEGLYTIMLRCDSQHQSEQVAKYPTRVTDIKADDGRSIVVFNILNADLGPDVVGTSGCFQDGYWQRKFSNGLNVGKNPVTTGYFKEYSAGDGGEQELQDMLALAATKTLARSTELVLV